MNSNKVGIFTRGILQGVGIMVGMGATTLLAVTVTGTINSFASGDTVSASLINENFTSLKTGIEAMKFGTRDTSVSLGTNYQAATDGFVTCMTGTTASSLEAYTDSSTTPTAAYARIDRDLTGSGNQFGSLTMPVRKGDYWRVDRSSGSTGSCTWLPLGN